MEICRTCGHATTIDTELNLYNCQLIGKTMSGNCQCKTGQYVEGQAVKPKKPSKYHNKKTIIDDMEFDSQHEAIRYGELKLLQQADEITALQTQVWFLLEPKNSMNNKAYYVADFTYYDLKRKEFVVEDAKGVRTAAYILKKKGMYNKYLIDIREV